LQGVLSILTHGFAAGASAGWVRVTGARGARAGVAGTVDDALLVEPEEKPKSAKSMNSRAITT
jgi:hypothetical protein